MLPSMQGRSFVPCPSGFEALTPFTFGFEAYVCDRTLATFPGLRLAQREPVASTALPLEVSALTDAGFTHNDYLSRRVITFPAEWSPLILSDHLSY